MKILAGHGYWETTRHPIGGEFHRAGGDGQPIIDIIEFLDSPVKGCDVVCSLPDGRKAACDSRYIAD